MPDAADRIRSEPKASRRQSPAAKRWMLALLPKSKRTVASAALVAMMIGVVVNAVALQHGRRIDLGPDLSATSAVRAVTPVASAEKPPTTPTPSAATEDQPPTPRPRPAPTTVASAHSGKPSDEIAEFLRTQGPEKRRLTLSAQNALVKLGYSIKATGTLDAPTRSALAEFEKSRHMPVSAELTAKVVKSLAAAAAN